MMNYIFLVRGSNYYFGLRSSSDGTSSVNDHAELARNHQLSDPSSIECFNEIDILAPSLSSVDASKQNYVIFKSAELDFVNKPATKTALASAFKTFCQFSVTSSGKDRFVVVDPSLKGNKETTFTTTTTTSTTTTSTTTTTTTT